MVHSIFVSVRAEGKRVRKTPKEEKGCVYGEKHIVGTRTGFQSYP